MTDDPPRSRLGRGLAALLADTNAQMPALPQSASVMRVPVTAVRANPHNPRQAFDTADLDDLAASIREKGVLQPIIVRPARGRDDTYEIVAGERRWRAAQRADAADIPVLVVEANDKEALELAIIENVQRSDLNAIDEARGYERLSAEFGYTHADLAKAIGKSRSHVANLIRLLKLPAPVSDMVVAGDLSAGHARALLAFDKPEPVARRVVERGLSVREVEHLAQRYQERQRASEPVEVLPPRPSRGRAEVDAIADELSHALGLAVALEHRGTGGELRIRYKTMEQLHTLCRSLRRG